ncbi:hypothetical protein U9M48_039180 [Paspalum notatum var. saurae]|uniref:Reverse transcriptase domain-containing protein n=1 Tax=Paspalum notatum var. saurae TaxID=547442 RepID=A0AAQ3XBU4_PASNO
MARLMGLQFKIVYSKGKENVAADALSRVAHLFALQAVSAVQPVWLQEVPNSYVTDPQAQQLLARLAIHDPDSQGFELVGGLIKHNGLIWVGNNYALQTKIIAAMHSSPIGGHSGVKATYYGLKRMFLWKGIRLDVDNFVKRWRIRRQAKHEPVSPPGLLQPLPVPKGAWRDITMDFIEGLPGSGPYTAILVVVDRFTKLSFKYFGPYECWSALEAAAYKIRLPDAVHSRLFAGVLDITKFLELDAADVLPEAILDRRLVKKGSHAITQVPLKWTNLLASSATWEDYTNTTVDERGGLKHYHLPKLSFPKFEGTNPKIWIAKCEDYFSIFSIRESMWCTKLEHRHYMEDVCAAVLEKFGVYEHGHALHDLLELKKVGTVEEYVDAFETLQYQVSLHNGNMGNLYFVSRFIRGLKPSLNFGTLSLNALAGTTSGGCMKLRALVNNKVSCQLTTVAPTKVKLANGDDIITDQLAPNLEWWCQGHTFATPMRVLPLGTYDAILGYDWLASHSPMDCDWQNHTLTFSHNNTRVTLKGVPPADLQLSEITAEQLVKWSKGNDIWAYALVHSVATESDSSSSAEISELLQEFSDVFTSPTTLPPHRSYDHTISLLLGSAPVNSRPYRYSPLHKDEIERQVRVLLNQGWIVHSNSPFASPVLLVQKKDGTWRMCVDYRRLNALTIKNRFPIPVVEEILDELAGTTHFTKLDLTAGYHQVRMAPQDEHKTAFKTHHGHYQFKVMPFGLTNAPATFQCIMNDILSPFLRKFVLVFMDDILVYSSSFTDHVQHLRAVLLQLKKHQFYLKPTKCSFAQSQIEYLGHIISADGVATDPAKTAIMQQWPTPTTITELGAFLGLFGYYEGYGILARPLTNLLKKNAFAWSQEATLAFEALKQAMQKAPVLALPDFQATFIVETDACDGGLGAVLMQHDRPIAFLSKALGDKHKHLSVYEKEFLAVIMAVERWRPYLQRQEFVIRTDHSSLAYLSEQNLHSDLQRKAMARLMGLQFKIVYSKGKENVAADALSRVAHLFALQAVSAVQPVWLQEVLNSYVTDPQAQQPLARLAIHSPDSQGFELVGGLIKHNGLIWVGNNSALQTKIIAAMHSSPIGGHSGVKATYYRLKRMFHWKGIRLDVDNFVKQWQICQQAKHEPVSPPGLLQPLPVPKGAWRDITMDFIEGLPGSGPYTCYIVTDRDRIFLSAFWKDLFNLLGTKLVSSAAYHPQTDGQTERRIGAAAYKIRLPDGAKIHPAFHVSQLKPFTPDYSPMYFDITKFPELDAADVLPEAILDRKVGQEGLSCYYSSAVEVD